MSPRPPRPNTTPTNPNANAKCQKCLQPGHWTFDCQQSQTYRPRPSRTALLANPNLRLPEAEIPADTLEAERETAAAEILNRYAPSTHGPRLTDHPLGVARRQDGSDEEAQADRGDAHHDHSTDGGDDSSEFTTDEGEDDFSEAPPRPKAGADAESSSFSDSDDELTASRHKRSRT